MGRVIALILAAATAAAAWSGPSLLQHALPLQARLLQWWTPGCVVQRMAIEPAQGSWQLVGRMVSTEYLVIDGRAIEPGLELQASTPARAGLRLPGVAALWLAWCCLVRPARQARPVNRVAMVLGLVLWPMAVALPPLVLAGQVWALLVPEPEPSLSWALAWISDRLLQGADLALAAAVTYLAAGSKPT